MKLDLYQRKDMFLRTECVIHNGLYLSDRLPYLGDILREDPRTLYLLFLEHGIDNIHVSELVREILKIELGTPLDSEMIMAFEQAKERVCTGERPENAWPSWYTTGHYYLPVASGQ